MRQTAIAAFALPTTVWSAFMSDVRQLGRQIERRVVRKALASPVVYAALVEASHEMIRRGEFCSAMERAVESQLDSSIGGMRDDIESGLDRAIEEHVGRAVKDELDDLLRNELEEKLAGLLENVRLTM